MSTRAIIALPVGKGYETAWCWNDGGPDNLGYELRRYFKDEASVRQLIKEHSFSTIVGPRTIIGYMREGDKCICLSNRFLLKHPYDGKVVEGGKNGFFQTVDEMLQCDLNYVYVFENGKWKTYK